MIDHIEHEENRTQQPPQRLDPENQRNAISKRGLATHVDGQGTTTDGGEQGTKRETDQAPETD